MTGLAFVDEKGVRNFNAKPGQNEKKHEPTNIAIVLACTYGLFTGVVHAGPAPVDRHLHTGLAHVDRHLHTGRAFVGLRHLHAGLAPVIVPMGPLVLV